MIRTAFFAACALSSTASMAQYVVRGEFNDWGNLGDLVMSETFAGSGVYTATATGLTSGQGYEFKCTTPDWSFNGPPSNARTVADANGSITFFFNPSTTYADGWMPNSDKRVGWNDSGQFDWELMGSVNGWSSPFAALNDMGGGLHQFTGVFAAGAYEFKFRRQGDWGYSIGSDFGNAAGNATFTSDGVTAMEFSLDLPNGRWRVNPVPEPTTLLGLGLGALVLARRRRS